MQLFECPSTSLQWWPAEEMAARWCAGFLIKNLEYPNSFLSVVTNLTVEFVGFLLLPSKVLAYAITDWQYCEAKMATK